MRLSPRLSQAEKVLDEFETKVCELLKMSRLDDLSEASGFGHGESPNSTYILGFEDGWEIMFIQFIRMEIIASGRSKMTFNGVWDYVRIPRICTDLVTFWGSVQGSPWR